MPVRSYREAITEAIVSEMRRDTRVFVIGEDVSGGAGCPGAQQDVAGGVFGVTKGLLTEFGPLRVIDTPISESAFVGAALGAALLGLRPIVDLMFADFVGVCFDQICNQIAKFHYMSGGEAHVPLVIRMANGAGLCAAAQHSQAIYPLVSAIPGLKCVVPSNAADAKGLMIAAIRDEDPVLFFEHKALYSSTAEVPGDAYTIPLGEATFVREGEEATIVAVGSMVGPATEAADVLREEGITCDVIDPRTTSPLDGETILESVIATGRLVVAEESSPRGSVSSDIAALVAEHGFASLFAPVVRVTAPHTPVPFAPGLEKCYLPDAARIAQAVRKLVRYGKKVGVTSN